MTTTVVYLTASSGNWQAPEGCFVLDSVECIGAGANGQNTPGANGGYGGGGGAWCRKNNISVTPGTNYPYTNGVNGGDTNFNDVCIAKGASGQTGGQASACTGDSAYDGGNGAAGGTASGNNGGGGGGGGGAAGPNGAGNTAPAVGTTLVGGSGAQGDASSGGIGAQGGYSGVASWGGAWSGTWALPYYTSLTVTCNAGGGGGGGAGGAIAGYVGNSGGAGGYSRFYQAGVTDVYAYGGGAGPGGDYSWTSVHYGTNGSAYGGDSNVQGGGAGPGSYGSAIPVHGGNTFYGSYGGYGGRASKTYSAGALTPGSSISIWAGGAGGAGSNNLYLAQASTTPTAGSAGSVYASWTYTAPNGSIGTEYDGSHGCGGGGAGGAGYYPSVANPYNGSNGGNYGAGGGGAGGRGTGANNANGGTAAPGMIRIVYTDVVGLSPANFTNSAPTFGSPALSLNAPTVTDVTANRGSIGGGTNVIVTGTNFFGDPTVTFGGVEATDVAVLNASTITCTTPAHAGGWVNVAVTTTAGTGTGNNLFLYQFVFAATTLISGHPVLGSRYLEGFLFATSFYNSSPVLPAVVLGVKRVLTASGVLSGGHPTVGNPIFMKVLPVASLTNHAPTLGAPALHQVHGLAANGLTNSSPVLPTLGFKQVHKVATSTLSSGHPSWNIGSFYVGYFFQPISISSGTPLLPNPVLSERNILTAVGIANHAPVLGAGVIKQTLTPLGLEVTGKPTFGAPELVPNIHLQAQPLTARVGVTANPDFSAYPFDPIVVHNSYRYDPTRKVSLFTNLNDVQEIDVAPGSLVGRHSLTGGPAQRVIPDPEMFEFLPDGTLTLRLNAGLVKFLFAMMNSDKHLVGTGLSNSSPTLGSPELGVN